jgi:hypothetical protein
MSVFDGEEDFASESTGRPRAWEVGDRVRIVGGSPQLMGAVGAVVEVDVPGRSPIRIAVEGRRGFGQVLRTADELEPEGEVAS